MGIAGAGLIRETEGPVPAHLRGSWTGDLWCPHSAAWWRRHRDRAGIMDVAPADSLPDGWRLWVDWLERIAPENVTEVRAWEAGSGSHLGYVRVVRRRRAEARLSEPIVSVPTRYA